jgi:hypothetical protein
MIGLLKHFIRLTMPVTIVATLAAVAYCCLFKDLIVWESSPNMMFVLPLVLVHSIALTFRVGRPGSAPESFIYARGHSRDSIWLAKLLATIVSALVVCGVFAGMTYLGLRAMVQDRVFENPITFVMLHRESDFGLYLPLLYLYVLPFMHYSWARWGQPVANRSVGPLVFGVCATLLFLGAMPGNLKVFATICGLIAAATAVVLGMLLHRKLEVM